MRNEHIVTTHEHAADATAETETTAERVTEDTETTDTRIIEDENTHVQHHGEDTVWSLMMRAIHESILFIGLFAVLALFGSYAFTGMAGVSAALLAIVTVILFCLSNPVLVAVLSRLHLRPAVHMTWLVIGWLVKIAILIVVLLFVPLIAGFQIKLFGILIIIGAGIVLAAEIRTAMHARIPYVKPSEVRTTRYDNHDN